MNTSFIHINFQCEQPFCFSNYDLAICLQFTDYFVLWDENILDCLLHPSLPLARKSKKLLQSLELPSGVHSGVDKRIKNSKDPDPRWLSKAQDLML